MARIRTIKPDFFRHAKLYKAEQETDLPLRVAFAGLWTAADRDGRFRLLPDELKLDCLPYDRVDFSRVLHALATRGFLVLYEHEGEVFCHIPSWRLHQFINNKEKASNIPAPTKVSIESMTPERVEDACLSRELPVSEVGVKGRGKEGERKGKEKQGKTASPAAPNDVDAQVWADWLKVRKGKNAAFTETTVKEIRAEAKKAGMTFNDALLTCCKRNWVSFEAAWLTNGKAANGSHSKQASLEERNKQAGDEWLRRHQPEPEIFDALATERQA